MSDGDTYVSFWMENTCGRMFFEVDVIEASSDRTYFLVYDCESTNEAFQLSSSDWVLMSSTPCPSAWTRYSEIDNKLISIHKTFGISSVSLTTHQHSVSGTTSNENADTNFQVDNSNNHFQYSSNSHTHDVPTFSSGDNSDSIMPPYMQAYFCRNNMLDMFEGSMLLYSSNTTIEGIDFYSENALFNNRFLFGANSYGSQGGFLEHFHDVLTNTNPVSQNQNDDNGPELCADTPHSHNINGTTGYSSNIPSYYSFYLGKMLYSNATITNDLFLFSIGNDGDIPYGWEQFDDANGYFVYIQNDFSYPETFDTGYGHDHSLDIITTSAALESVNCLEGTTSNRWRANHTHDFSGSVANEIPILPHVNFTLWRRKSNLMSSLTSSYGTEELVGIFCNSISIDSPSVCSGRGNCTEASVCVCELGRKGDDCELDSVCYGFNSSDIGACSGNGTCTADDTCVCDDGYTGNDCGEWFCYDILNTHDQVCGGNGYCVDVDVCDCFEYHSGSNCSVELLRCDNKCGIGEYYTNCTDKCYLCHPGFYCDGSDSFECEVGKYNPESGSSSSSECLTCPSGHYSTTTGATKCLPCEKGKKCDGTNVVNCVSGYYSSIVGQKDCFACPDGHVCADVDQNPVACDVGSFNDHTGGLDSSCSTCGNGEYTLSKGMGQCLTCEAGFRCSGGSRTVCLRGDYSSEGSNTCQGCSNGWYTLTEGSESCTICPKGFRCPNANEDPIICEMGFHNDQEGQIICDACLPSQYTLTEGSISCLDCEAGMYCDGTNTYACPDGTYSPVGSTECFNCTAGHYCVDSSASPEKCPMGTFADGELMRTKCEICGDDEYTSDVQSLSCTPVGEGEMLVSSSSIPELCHAGFYSGIGDFGCLPCPMGTYSLNRGSSYCNSCPAGSKCPDPTVSPIECEGGYISVENSTSCVICSPGTYSSVDRTSCMQCEPGYMCPNVLLGRIQCPGGYYTESYGSKECTESPAGYYSPNGNSSLICESGYSFPGQTICYQCPAGLDCTDHTMPIACSEGYYSDIGVDACTICPAGKRCYKDKITDCQSGYYSPDESRYCYLCPPGSECPTTDVINPCEVVDGHAVFSEVGSIGCYGCPAGWYCNSTNELPVVCPEGSYSADGALSCTPCLAGEYCENVDSSSSTVCNAGYFSFEGMKNCIACPAGLSCSTIGYDGTVCGTGTYSLGGQDSCTNTPVGEYSLSPDEKPQKCALGKYTSAINQVECLLVPAGYYSLDPSASHQQCGVGTWSGVGSTSCLPCGKGFYCPALSTSPNPVGQECLIGRYCPEGTNTQIQCPAGTYGKFAGMDSQETACEICPVGYYCGVGTVTPTICDLNYFCPAGTTQSSVGICPPGTYQDNQGTKSLDECKVCNEGNNCLGLGFDPDVCGPGYFCPERAKEPDMHACPEGTFSSSTSLTSASECTPCPVGSYCLQASISPIFCSNGTYNPFNGAGGSHECFDCPAGYSCDVDGMSVGNNCTVGHYCPFGSRSASDYPCPEGTFTDELTLHRIEDCQICPEGYYCGEGSSSAEIVVCPSGYYCPGSKTGNIDYYGDYVGQYTDFGYQFPCPEGTFSNTQGLTHRENCTICTPGKFCLGGETVESGDCALGHYCPEGTTRDKEYPCAEGTYYDLNDATIQGSCKQCTEGNYCPEGSGTPIPCEAGTFAKVTGTKRAYVGGDSDSCSLCLGGFFCVEGENIPQPCDAGYFSDDGSGNCTLCEAGYYCEQNTSRSTMLNTFVCDGGYFCDEGTSIEPNASLRCSLGSYCPKGSPIEIPCPKGTYNPTLGISSIDQCKPCDPGYYCLLGSDSLTGQCSSGYYCEEGSFGPTQIPCPEGTYIDITGARSEKDCLTCTQGYFCQIGTTTPVICPVGFYCEVGSKEGTPCPKGTFSNDTGLTSEEYCRHCPEGMYCSNVGISTPTGNCDAGYYCSGKSTTSKPSGSFCPKGSYCPEGSPFPIACNPGTYNRFTGGKSIDDCVFCPEGYYCASSNGFIPTGECLAGYYCEQGSTSASQFVSPKGYYSTAGSSMAIPCDKGSFADEFNSSSCTPCTEGYSCPNLNMESAGDICPRGHYCPEASTYEKACPPGTFSYSYGNTDIGDCEECLEGHYCEGSGLHNTSAPCKEGFFCTGGSVEATPVNKLYGDVCPPGNYCPLGSSEPVKCPEGTFNPSFGRKSISECVNCLPGNYCPDKEMTNSTLPCDEGYYCITKSSMKNPFNKTFGDICPLGYYCPLESSSPIPCESGFFANETGMPLCDVCPAGYYCPIANFDPIICPKGRYCVEMSKEPITCPVGYFLNATNGKSVDDCLPCDGGYYCGIRGLFEPEGICIEGFFCESGCEDNSGKGGKGGICPKGHFCVEKSVLPVACSIGTYNPNEGAVEEGACLLCKPGWFCNETGLESPAGECEEGYYCPTGSTSPNEIPCPEGSYCEKGGSHPLPCKNGKYQPGVAKSSCDDCPVGNFCLSNTSSPIPCPMGYYCELGTGAVTLDIGCPAGTFINSTGGKSVDDCIQCDPGKFCSQKGLVEPNGICSEGYYCDGGSIDNMGKMYVGDDPNDCWAGYYCPEESPFPIPCPSGSFSSKENLIDISNCDKCSPGMYCSGTGLLEPSGNCSVGYFCIKGADNESPVDGITGNVCPEGNFCPIGSISPIPCSEGYFSNTTGLGVCLPCLERYYCPKIQVVDPLPCPKGRYCPGTIGSDVPKCPVGSFNNNTGLSAIDECVLCTEGNVCSLEGLEEPDLLCERGYFCVEGSVNTIGDIGVLGGTAGGICNPGHYCPKGVSIPEKCPYGSKNTQTGMWKEEHCEICTAGSYCLEGNINPFNLCHAGYYCPPGSFNFDEIDCPPGYYCPLGSSYPIGCEDGFFQDEFAQFNCKICPGGSYCLHNCSVPVECPEHYVCEEGTDHPVYCLGGTFGNMTGFTSQDECHFCPPGKYCDGGRILGDCFAGYICYSNNSVPTPVSELPNGDLCPVGFFCLEGADLPTPCPNGTIGNEKGGYNSDICGICAVGKKCDSNKEVTLPNGVKLITSVASPCPRGYYCPVGEQPIPCEVGTYNPNYSGKNESDCFPCTGGYACDSVGLHTLIPSMECQKGFFCLPGTPASSLPLECPIGTFNNFTKGSDLSSCLDCIPGYYCDESAMTDPKMCGKGLYCPEGSIVPKKCPPGFYCPENSEKPLVCPAGYYCFANSHSPKECHFDSYCPEGYEMPIPCPLGYRYISVLNSTLRTSLEDSCEMCEAGTYGITNLTICKPCTEGYVCLGGTKTPFPIDIPLHRGYKCPAGHYCPLGSSKEMECPMGYYQKNVGASKCQLCPTNHYNDKLGQSYCAVCGSNAVDIPSRTTCECIGFGRSYQKSDGNCLCFPGFALIEENIQQENKDSNQDCQQIVYDPCSSTGESIRNTITGKCESVSNCDSFCSYENRTIKGFISSSGICECQEVIDENIICDSECRKNRLRLKYDSNTNSLRVWDPVLKEFVLTYSFDSVSSSSSTLECENSCEIEMLDMDDNGIKGLLDVERSYFNDLLNGTHALSESRRAIDPFSFSSGAKGIYSPLVCLNYGEGILFSVSCGNEGKKHYPQYLKDSLLNTNKLFDYGDFRLLENYCKSNLSISTFLYMFKQSDSPGVYVFYDAGNTEKIIIVQVMKKNQKCPSSSSFKPITPANMVELGINNNEEIRLTPDWPLIVCLFLSFILFFFVFIGAIKYLYSSSGFKSTTIKVNRDFIDIKSIKKFGLLNNETMKLYAMNNDDEMENIIDLEDFDVEEFYSILFGHTKEMYTNIEDFKEGFYEVYNEIMEETDSIKSILKNKYGLYNIDVDDYVKKINRYKEQLKNEEFDYNENLIGRIVNEFNRKLESLKGMDVIKGEARLLTLLESSKKVAIEECERIITQIERYQEQLKNYESLKDYDSIERVNRLVVSEIDGGSSRLIKCWKKINDSKRKLEKSNEWNSFAISSSMSRTLKRLLNMSLGKLKKKFGKQ